MRLYAGMITMAGALALAPGMAGLQTAAPLADARIAHIAVAVRDIDRTLQTLTEVLGVDPVRVGAMMVDTPDGSKVAMKVVSVRLSNFQIEVDQPNGSPGPTQAFLDKYGQGIQHLGIGVGEPLEPRVTALVQRGGRWTIGAPHGRFAFVDLATTLGTTIDFSQGAASAAANAGPAPGVHAGGLASYPVGHIVCISPDLEATAKAFSDVFGDAPSAVRVVKSLAYPTGSTASPDAQMKNVVFRHNGTEIEIIQPVGGPSPAADFLAQRQGPALYALAFDVGDKIDEFAAALQAKGGKRILGREGSGYAWVDFTDSLGLVIELRRGGR